MAKDSTSWQMRQRIAQLAAAMMAEDGIHDFAYAKKKAGRQLGAASADLPSNAEIEAEIRVYHELYNSDDQPASLRQLRSDALVVMQLLQRFNPHLTGAVLEGTAGKYAETHIHLFADSLKDVEIFLLNSQVPYETNEKSYRVSGASEHRKGGERKKVPVFTLDGPNGLIRLSVFEVDGQRVPTKHAASGGNALRAGIEEVRALLREQATPDPQAALG
ncbi:hypothetical protein ED236_04280 [Pseudomethylobacillus aquaticus]|uniref:Nucleotidyltransferase n=1 Tax=Pseudomethylobacillus aquaticus TaxID=2676064 RepID=A0A3N0V294_9PROT|nr:hypothetical protein [Pseudomethylobacillus aquaticus]ROH86927.1 hypothetical protein ED236_04280 [Pseudomethylobacillus aquaticus]